MLIKDALSYMKKDINYFYVDIVDMEIMPHNIFFFAREPEDLIKHKYISVTKREEDVLISIHSDNEQLIEEALSYSKTLNVNNIYLSLDINMGVNLEFLQNNISLAPCEDSDFKDYGVYGCVEHIEFSTSAMRAKHPDDTDCEIISALPNLEWAFLPQRIKRLNKSDILIATAGHELLGYLVSCNGIEGYRDIAMIFVHKNHRQKKVASLLVDALLKECEKKSEKLYYGTASSLESSLLAKSLKITQIRPSSLIYKLFSV